MSDETSWFVPSNIFAGSFLPAAADNIDIKEETQSGEGTAHVLGSVIYQAKRDNVPLFTSEFIASDRRIRTVKNLTMFNLHTQNLKTLHRLVGKVNVKESKTCYIYGQSFDFLADYALKNYTN